MCSHRGCGGGRTAEATGAGLGVGFTETAVEGSHVPGSVWPALVAVCGGRMVGHHPFWYVQVLGGGTPGSPQGTSRFGMPACHAGQAT